MISPESAVNIEPVLDTPVIETIDEETVKTEEISTALSERKAGNITGAGSPAKQRLSEQDIHNLSEYIQTLNKF